MEDIRILDACCGSRMFWFDKNESHTTFMDIRQEKFEIHDKKVNVDPDIIGDFRVIAIWILLSAGLNIWQMDKIAELEEKRPMVIYKADNQGAEIFGKVVEKGRHGKLYTLTIRDYGIFVVTKDVYEKVKLGDEVML